MTSPQSQIENTPEKSEANNLLQIPTNQEQELVNSVKANNMRNIKNKLLNLVKDTSVDNFFKNVCEKGLKKPENDKLNLKNCLTTFPERKSLFAHSKSSSSAETTKNMVKPETDRAIISRVGSNLIKVAVDESGKNGIELLKKTKSEQNNNIIINKSSSFTPKTTNPNTPKCSVRTCSSLTPSTKLNGFQFNFDNRDEKTVEIIRRPTAKIDITELFEKSFKSQKLNPLKKTKIHAEHSNNKCCYLRKLASESSKDKSSRSSSKSSFKVKALSNIRRKSLCNTESQFSKQKSGNTELIL